MAATIRKDLSLESELLRGSGGNFIVSADGVVIFSKKEQGRFPTEQEILDTLRALGA